MSSAGRDWNFSKKREEPPGNVVRRCHDDKKELVSFGLNGKNYVVLLIGLIVLLIVDILQEKKSVRERIEKRSIWIRWGLYLVAFLIILLFGMYGPGYDQTQFVYMQF